MPILLLTRWGRRRGPNEQCHETRSARGRRRGTPARTADRHHDRKPSVSTVTQTAHDFEKSTDHLAGEPFGIIRHHPPFFALSNRCHRSPDSKRASPEELALTCVFTWWRGWDLNPRPSGYEPDELPDCSTPRRKDRTYHRIARVQPAPRHGRSGTLVSPVLLTRACWWSWWTPTWSRSPRSSTWSRWRSCWTERWSWSSTWSAWWPRSAAGLPAHRIRGC